MTFFLGMIGILQMMFVPGLILYRVLRQKALENSWLQLGIVVALSLVFNYFLVFSLTALHLYLPSIVRILFLIEFIALFCAYPYFFRQNLFSKAVHFECFSGFSTMHKEHTKVFFGLMLLFLALWLGLWVYSWGNVFGIRDPTVSYNIWALSWASDQFPTLTWHYPQLISSNWSIPYVMMGTLPPHIALEIFPASMNVFFPALLIMIFLALFQMTCNRAYLIAGIIISFYMLIDWLYIQSGYVDWICAFLNILTLSLLYHKSQNPEKANFSYKTYILILLLASACALTKPAGVYAAFFIPWLMLCAYHIKKIAPAIGLVVASYLILILLIAPWYIYAQMHILHYQGSEYSDISFLTWNIFRAFSWFNFFGEILNYGWLVFVFIVAGFLFSQNLPRFWRHALYFYAPYYLLWAAFFSYDPRNLTFILPLFAITTGLIISKHDMDISLTRWLYAQKSFLNQLWLALFLILIAILVASLQDKFSEKNLVADELASKNQIYNSNPGIVKLINYEHCPGFSGRILDPTLVLGTMPVFAPYIVQLPVSYFGPDMLPQVFNQVNLLQQALVSYPDIRYFLIDGRYIKLLTSKPIDALLKTWVQQGKLKIVLDDNKLVLYQIMVPTQKLFN